MDTPRSPSAVGTFLVTVLVVAGVVGLIFIVRAPTADPPEAATVPIASVQNVVFDVSAFEEVCHSYVDGVGLVDYAGLKASPARLDAFLKQVEGISPHTNLAAFPGEAAALAYWLNAYNAWMLRAVLDAYPVDSVMDIGDDPGVFDAKGRICGGRDLSLNGIEHEIVRKEFLEPRVHFALNCASMGCPRLPAEAFTPARLDAQLEREARRFFDDPTHLDVDPEIKTVYLSSILDWYGEDFVRWLTEVKGIEEPSLLDYVKIYAPEELASQIGDDFSVEFLDYGWGLNDQAAEWAAERRGD